MTVDYEMFCDRCGCHHGVVWFAPSDIWNAVMRDGDRGKPDEYGFCCPNCFLRLACERGIDTTGWLITPFDDGPVRHADDIRLVSRQVALVEALRLYVWQYSPEAGWPICAACNQTERDGHTDDCPVGQALAAWDAE